MNGSIFQRADGRLATFAHGSHDCSFAHLGHGSDGSDDVFALPRQGEGKHDSKGNAGHGDKAAEDVISFSRLSPSLPVT